MDFVWDENKRLVNLAKHRLDFADAASLDWPNAQAFLDDRRDYGEPRYSVFGTLNGRLYFVALTVRDNQYRIISFRKARQKEFRRYVETQNEKNDPPQNKALD